MSEKRVTVHQENLPEAQPGNLMEIIQKVVSGPLDLQKVEVLERLLAMQERVQAQQRKEAFIEAMRRLQAKLPQIIKMRSQLNKDGTLRNKYVPIEDLDVVLRPLCDAEGFSISYDTHSDKAGQLELTCHVAHHAGHVESRSLPLPLDSSQFRTAGQNVASTVTTGRRLLLKLQFNIIERDEDKDFAEVTHITEEQARDIRTMLGDTGSKESVFLEMIAGVPSIEEIEARDFKRIINVLEAKARTKK